MLPALEHNFSIKKPKIIQIFYGDFEILSIVCTINTARNIDFLILIIIEIRNNILHIIYRFHISKETSNTLILIISILITVI